MNIKDRFMAGVVGPIIENNDKGAALDAFTGLLKENPSDVFAILVGSFPSFNGIAARTPYIDLGTSREILESFSPEFIANAVDLDNLVRTVCFEGRKEAFGILDRLVNAGVVSDQIDWKPDSPESVMRYVDRLIELDAEKYGPTIRRGDVPIVSQWEKSVYDNPLIGGDHDVFSND